MLIILDREHKLSSTQNIDYVISTEIPDLILEPRLHEIVLRYMVHGLCDPHSNLPCVENEIYTKKFPKSFQRETVMNVNGYPIYIKDEARLLLLEINL